MLEEMQLDYAIRSSVVITKLLPLGRAHPEEEEENEEEEQHQKGEIRFFENIFSLDYLTFWLSYSIYSIITGSGTQQVSFMEKFCVKAGISFRFILYLALWVRGG